MSEFIRRKHATLSPTRCCFCADTEGPFIDTHLDLPGYGHLWVCAANERRSGCVRAMAKLDGLISPDEHDALIAAYEELQDESDRVRALLEGKKLPVGEVLEVLGR